MHKVQTGKPYLRCKDLTFFEALYTSVDSISLCCCCRCSGSRNAETSAHVAGRQGVVIMSGFGAWAYVAESMLCYTNTIQSVCG
jgi:hypothetical protein